MPYLLEALVVLLLVLGSCCGLRSRFFLMVASGVAFDAFIHLVLGFGLNEVYIMTAHWVFVIPIAVAFLMRRLAGRWLMAVRATTLLLTIVFYVTNLVLMTGYFCG